MSTYVETIDRLLFEKTGKRASELDYVEDHKLPEDDDRYNNMLPVGNIHLASGMIKTKKKADELVNRFLNTIIP